MLVVNDERRENETRWLDVVIDGKFVASVELPNDVGESVRALEVEPGWGYEEGLEACVAHDHAPWMEIGPAETP